MKAGVTMSIASLVAIVTSLVDVSILPKKRNSFWSLYIQPVGDDSPVFVNGLIGATCIMLHARVISGSTFLADGSLQIEVFVGKEFWGC